MKTLTTPQPVRTEMTIKRSRFITTLARAEDEDAARAQIATVRKEFADARHNCQAFVVSAPDGTPIARSSDDGEPSGTAGMPMLETLRGADVIDVVAVVTRYFGGIKLGTGGLVRAYSGAVADALAAAPLAERTSQPLLQVTAPLATAGPLEAALRDAGALICDTAWTSDLTVVVAGTEDDLARWESLAREVTRGQATIARAGTRVVEIPVR
ncbi:MAG: YigZ family protein [Actinomycetaceae bacterium]|nr:YigZ family protein [Actinomycetaceae bacterium]MDU0970300.1 YigZ family protein [Actinomycetaceae bacterium]